MLVLSLIITGTKFLLVCIFRSIPLMDDNFLSFTINIIVNIVIFLATMSKFYIEDRPNVAEVIDNFPFRATYLAVRSGKKVLTKAVS